jgi:hypothetical protein
MDSYTSSLTVVCILWIGILMITLIIGVINNIKKSYRMRALKMKAERKYIEIVKEAYDLIEHLNVLPERREDPLDLLVQFFSLTSPVCDKYYLSLPEIEYFLTDDQRESLSKVMRILTNMGRNIYGMNRTERGQGVTHSNVYVGNVCGIWTNTVAFWKNERSRLTGLHKDTYAILQAQALDFMSGNVEAMKKVLPHAWYAIQLKRS